MAIKRGFVCFLLQHLLYTGYFIYNENESKEFAQKFSALCWALKQNSQDEL